MTKGDKPHRDNDFDATQLQKPRRQPAPVITPISTGWTSGQAADKQEDREPNWSKWKNMLHAPLWQVVALSLSIEPAKVRHAEHQWMSGPGAPRRFDESEEFQCRYDVAMAQLAELRVTASRLDGGNPEVTLPSFATLANACGWSLPGQFPVPRSAPSWTLELRQQWIDADLWSEAELQAVCCGLIPDASRPSTTVLNAAAEKIRRAIVAKALSVANEPSDATTGDKMYGHSRFFAPADATRWALGKFPDFPFRLEDFAKDCGPSKDPRDLIPRAETTYLNMIGALLDLVRNPREGRDSDAAVIRELIDNYGDKPGISKTTLEAKFANARRALRST